MEKRDHDIFMELLDNPGANLNTMITVGLTPSNTSLQDRETYKQDQFVKDFFKDDVNGFNEVAFNNAYDTARYYYNNLSSITQDEAVKKQATFFRDNIWAPVDKRDKEPRFKQIRIPNANEQVYNLNTLGRIESPTKSVDELAQAHKVLLNPKTAGTKLENAQWGDSPNDSFTGYFFDTLVLAQYEEDGTHEDPITGEIVKHYKGDLKLDNDGKYYYERLDGRNVYDKRVLNKMNVLTTDGSFANKFDFFDSDDLEQKSIGGSILKNTALVGSMFIPYVGPWITGISVATQLAGLGATLGKMITGSDNPVLSNIEGWSKSLNRQTAKTQYAQENVWCWENYINLIGDVAAQLTEQRFIFNNLPYIFKGTNVMTESGRAAKLKKLQDARKQLLDGKIQELMKNPKSLVNLNKSIKELKSIETLGAQAELDSFIKGYQKLGEIFSKGYMTAITVGDTYGEAKNAGASDLDATLLTLGYAAGEYAILNTGIGEWILPELRANKYKSQAIAKALTGVDKEIQDLRQQFGSALKNMPKEGKKEYVKKLFNMGKSIANAEYANGTKTLKATLAAGLGEGVEEVSEELLADFSKGCYDVVKWLQGEGTRLDAFGYNFKTGLWDPKELIDRYGMSLAGGFVGGGIANVAVNYKTFNSLSNMTSEQAMRELVYIARNEGIDKFIKDVNKTTLGDKNLSATEFEIKDGDYVYAPGTETNNQDLFAKNAVIQQAKLVKEILDVNGASLSDESFLSTLSQSNLLGDLRYNALYQSTTAGSYIEEYTALGSKLLRLNNELKSIIDSAKDSNKDGTVNDWEQRKNKLNDEQKQAVKQKEDQIKEVKQQLLDLLEGKRTYDFVAESLFEMTDVLSGIFTTTTFPLYAEHVTGKKYSEISEDTKAKLYESYTQWKTGEGRQKIKDMSAIYRKVAELSSKTILDQNNKYLQQFKDLQILASLTSNIYQVDGQDETSWLQSAQVVQNSSENQLIYNLIQTFGSQSDIQTVNDIVSRIQNIDPNLSLEEKDKEKKILSAELRGTQASIIIDNLGKYFDPILKMGFINTETKDQVHKVIENLKQYSKQRLWDLDEDPSVGLEVLTSWDNRLKELDNIWTSIDQLSNTPFESNLNEFAISIGKEPINITQLLHKLNQVLEDTSKDVTRFNMDKDMYTELDNAIHTIEFYKAAILGARTNAADIDDRFGYNATLNEISNKLGDKRPQLAEIDNKVADIFIADINTNLNKLRFLYQLYKVNQGQKLVKQDRITTLKDIALYKSLRNIISVPDNDKLKTWKGFLDLYNVIEGCKIHKSLSENNSDLVPTDKEVEYEKEKLQIQDAIYDFFQANNDILDTRLTEFLNPKRFQLYTEAKTLLDENMTSIDDNSLLWWIAGRAAVKASAFYNQYEQIIDPKAEKPLAPIPTQELAVYNNYANIVNGNMFEKFYKAFRESMLEDWKDSTVEQREKKLKLINKDSSLASYELADYALNIIPVPKYSNIVLTEGVPGSGKTTAVFKQTVELLRKFNPDLLRSVAVVHGASNESAGKLSSSLGFTDSDSKSYGLEEWMKEISVDWQKRLIDPKTHNQIIPKNDCVITDKNEVRTSLNLKETNNPPSLIIIDEISKFSAYDLDLIDMFAKKHGITVLVAGDYDQSGVVGSHTITINGKDMIWEVQGERTYFSRSFKLGVSMRTDNSLKTWNQQTLQSHMWNPKPQVPLKYYEDETGIYGDKVFYPVTDSIMKSVQVMINTLKNGEKIGYICDDTSSELYQILSSDQYKPYIDIKEGGSAQGLESQYYIIEATNMDSDQYLKDVYTGITRAEQGSILIINDAEGVIRRVQMKEMVSEDLNENLIRPYSDKRKKILKSVIKWDEKVQFIERTKDGTITVMPPTNTQGLGNGIDSTPPAKQPVKTVEDLFKEINECDDVADIDQFENFYRDNPLLKDSVVQKALQDKRMELDPDTYPLVELSWKDVPEDIREDLLNASESARQNPRKDNGLDQNDNESDLKYGDIVKVTVDNNSFYGVIVGIKLRDDNNHSYEILDPKKKENNTWGYESWPYFRSRIDGVIKSVEEEQLPPEEPEPLIYEDNIKPITGTDIIPEEQYMEQIDESTQNKNIPTSTAEPNEGSSITIDMLLHSFNTFETGVFKGDDDMPVPNGGKEWGEARIDSINGLIKIDRVLGNPIKTHDEYVKILGKIRSILFNTKEKADISKKLKEELGLGNLDITFALKSSPYVGKNNDREFVESKPSPFSKGKSERTLFNGSTDIRSHECNPKNIVAIIGNNETGNILEIPLLQLSSPFTLLQISDGAGGKIFEEIYKEYKTLLDKGLSKHEISLKLIDRFEGETKYKHLINLLKLFNFTDSGIYYIKDNEWTIANNLFLYGPEFVKTRGWYQDEFGLSYDQNSKPEDEWQNVEEQTKETQSKITSNILVSLNGLVEASNGRQYNIVHAGHPFILKSYDLSLDTDQKIADYFILQETDANVPRKVQLMYILPPKATIGEYFENINKILNKQSDVKTIGELFTAYKLMKILLKDDNFVNLFKSRSQRLYERVVQAIKELDDLPNNSAKKNRLYQTQDWSDTGLTSKPRALDGLLQGALMSIIYDKYTYQISKLPNKYELNQSNLELVENILKNNNINGVYYNVKIPKDGGDKISQFNIPIQESGYKLYGKPFKIHGKTDSYVYSGDMNWLVEKFLGALKPLSNGHMFTEDGFLYLKYRTTPTNETTEQRQKNNIVNYIKNKVGKDYTSLFESKSLQEALEQVVRDINNEDNSRVAFIINGKIKISNQQSRLKGKVWVKDKDNNTLHDISSIVDNNGHYLFMLTINGEDFYADFDGNELSLTKAQSNQLQVDPENEFKQSVGDLKTYQNNIGLLLQDILRFYPQIEEAINSSSLKEFMDNINMVDSYDIEDFESVKDESEIAALLKYLDFKIDGNIENNSCSLNITVKF